MISGNSTGVLISSDASDNNVIGNVITGNIHQGVIQVSGNGTSIVRNHINSNGNQGILIQSGTGNRLSENSIHSNAFLGIDLGSAHVTPNDPGDGDTGPNNLQNFPVLTSALVGSSTTIAGTLNSTANTTFTVELFSNAVADPTGFGEGETFLGSTTVITDATGNGSFSVTMPTVVPIGHFITATATDPSNNTSEFSQTFEVLDPFLVTSPLDIVDPADGVTTFREAISNANSIPGTDTISFNIPGVGVHTIQPLSALPTIRGPVIIDGYTQPGASPNTNSVGSGLNTVLMIDLDGTNAVGTRIDGLVVSAGNSIIRGLAINRFSGDGIELLSSNNIVDGNYVGTDVSGMVDHGNTSSGLRLSGNIASTRDNLIGGTTPASRNLISGNNQRGLLMVGGATTGNTVQGNLIGTNASGTASLGNSEAGVELNGAVTIWRKVNGTDVPL